MNLVQALKKAGLYQEWRDHLSDAQFHQRGLDSAMECVRKVEELALKVVDE